MPKQPKYRRLVDAGKKLRPDRSSHPRPKAPHGRFTVSVKLSTDEWRRINLAAEKLHQGPSTFIRHAAMAHAGVMVPA